MVFLRLLSQFSNILVIHSNGKQSGVFLIYIQSNLFGKDTINKSKLFFSFADIRYV
jgi:hypothetical protein